MSSDLVQAFYQRVLERGGTLLPPLAPDNLEQFEQDHGIQLPTVLRDLYLISNGTEYDDDLNRIVPLEELDFSASFLFGKVIWFFDHCIFARVWGVVSNGQVIDSSDRLETASVSDFFQKYIDHGIWPG